DKRSSRIRKIRHPEAFAIRARREPRDALEQAAEECSVLVADLPADRLDGRIGAFETSLRLLDAQPLHVDDRRQAGRVLEAALERARREPRALDHLLDGI